MSGELMRFDFDKDKGFEIFQRLDRAFEGKDFIVAREKRLIPFMVNVLGMILAMLDCR